MSRSTVVTRFTLLTAALCCGLKGRAQANLAPADRFEVASVRLTATNHAGLTSFGPPNTSQFAATSVSLMFLIETAFGVDPNEVLDQQHFIPHDHYDVVAKAAEGIILNSDRLAPMLRELLAERFNLTTHTEEKVVKGYALVVAKSGPKLTKDGSVKSNVIWKAGLQGSQISLDTLASMLARPVGAPIENDTGIVGNYDIRLTFSPEPDASNQSRSTGPSIFTALQEQLGLRLQTAKVTTKFLVIDHCERIPVEN